MTNNMIKVTTSAIAPNVVNQVVGNPSMPRMRRKTRRTSATTMAAPAREVTSPIHRKNLLIR
jgi:hypothetical protein